MRRVAKGGTAHGKMSRLPPLNGSTIRKKCAYATAKAVVKQSFRQYDAKDAKPLRDKGENC